MLRCPVCTQTSKWKNRKSSGNTVTGNCAICHTRLTARDGRVYVTS